MAPHARLNAGLLVRREHKLIVGQRLSFPHPFVQVKNPPSLNGEARVAREDPAPMLPGANRVFMKPAPDRTIPDGCDQARPAYFCGDVADTETGKRQAALGRQLTGQGFDLHDHLRGGKPWVGQGEDALPNPLSAVRRSAYATCSRHRAPDADTGLSRRWATPRPHAESSLHDRLHNVATYNWRRDAGARAPLRRTTRSGTGWFWAWPHSRRRPDNTPRNIQMRLTDT